MWIIILLIPLLIAIILAFIYFRQEKMTSNTVLCFTGGLGSGKTFNAVRMAIKFYKKQNFSYKLSKAIFGKRSKKDKPFMYSNIPVFIDKKTQANVLTRDHLLLRADLPEKAIVLIDEVGQVASQYDYDNPYVMCQIQELVRFYRHYTDGKLILTDQSSSNIVVPIRRRINYIYCLNDFCRVWHIMPMFRCNVSCLEVTEESMTNTNDILPNNSKLITTEKKQKPYFCGYLPYKWQKFKHYDSRCYSIRYNHNLLIHTDEQWEKLKTNYIIDVDVSESQRKEYHKNRKRID